MKLLIAGMGISGIETARFLSGRGEAFDTFDDRKDRQQVVAAIGEGSFRHHRETPDLSGYSGIVISPGIGIKHPLTQRALDLGAPISSEVEFAAKYAKGTLIAVTGSNGKSTTVSLIHHILTEAGRESVLCGNIGVPFIARVDDNPNRIYVLEISSFQMEHAPTFRPHAGVLLNISPDHLDRHGSLQAYTAAKLRMFANQEPADRAWVHPDYLDRIPGRAEKRPVPGPDILIENGFLRTSADFRVAENALALPGSHNRTNALFACAVAEWLGVSQQDAARAMSSFPGLEHRMEIVGMVEGRHWINDSKATNVHATQAALASMTGDYVLILGGCDKGERFESLDFSGRPPKAVIAYGETAPLIAEDLAAFGVIQIPRFEDACRRGHRLAGSGGTLLLAPACASFDQFENYTERGRSFKNLFSRIAEKTSCP